MLVPGAIAWGRMDWSKQLGPRLLLLLMTQFAMLVSRLPVPQAFTYDAGAPTLPTPGPLLPVAKSGKMPAFTQLVTPVWKSGVVQRELPQLLLEMRGRSAGLACVPLTRVGASVHW